MLIDSTERFRRKTEKKSNIPKEEITPLDYRKERLHKEQLALLPRSLDTFSILLFSKSPEKERKRVLVPYLPKISGKGAEALGRSMTSCP
jgi:hypothetical protein